VKRSDFDIKDDGHNIVHRSTPSYSTKLNRDYNSNISCLPGQLINNPNGERPALKMRRNQTSDIFNVNPGYNSFNISNRKVETVNRIFGQSNNEKRLIPNPRAQRPNVIRNVFESQISIV
jgi:hypothetical protein